MELLKRFALVLLVSCCTVSCQLLAKQGVSKILPLEFSTRPLQTLFAVATSAFIVGGLAIQGCGFLVWLTVISRSNLTWAIGVASAAVYLLTAVSNKVIFREGVSRVQVAGLIFITLGIILLSFRVHQSQV